VRAICMLRSMWRGLETESRSGLHGHERGNPGHRQGHDLKDHRASPRPYQGAAGSQRCARPGSLIGTSSRTEGSSHVA
jgi:hypothetical protein